jgi:hypothetical protein
MNANMGRYVIWPYDVRKFNLQGGESDRFPVFQKSLSSTCFRCLLNSLEVRSQKRLRNEVRTRAVTAHTRERKKLPTRMAQHS